MKDIDGRILCEHDGLTDEGLPVRVSLGCCNHNFEHIIGFYCRVCNEQYWTGSCPSKEPK